MPPPLLIYKPNLFFKWTNNNQNCNLNYLGNSKKVFLYTACLAMANINIEPRCQSYYVILKNVAIDMSLIFSSKNGLSVGKNVPSKTKTTS